MQSRQQINVMPPHTMSCIIAVQVSRSCCSQQWLLYNVLPCQAHGRGVLCYVALLLLQLLLDNFAEMAPIIYTPTVSKGAA
jgi:hypothetical protein